MWRELVATHLYPRTQTKFVKRVAKKLTAILACYLVNEAASMVSPVAAVENKKWWHLSFNPFSLLSTGQGQSILSCCTLLFFPRRLQQISRIPAVQV